MFFLKPLLRKRIKLDKNIIITSRFHRLSKVFQPTSVLLEESKIKTKRKDLSNSQKLMLELGIIKQANPGCFHFLPLGVKALEKLIKIVDEEMQRIEGQKIILPALIRKKLWEISGRLENVAAELIQITDRHKQEYILSPTHEESVCDILSSGAPLSYKQLPLRLYQITDKYRDEIKPRFGLLRSRQFLMKDLYTFDIDLPHAHTTYEIVCASYEKIFHKIGIEFIKVLGSSGIMGGSLSHEFHFKADMGEDKIFICQKCNYAANAELVAEEKCPKCESIQTGISYGIEVGHTFILGDKYSHPLNAQYLSSQGKRVDMQMGCFGLGLTRILAAAIEVLSNETEIRWPDSLAPYSVLIIPPKEGSKEEEQTKGLTERLCSRVESLPGLENEVLIDDRTSYTIGRRVRDGRRLGYPFIVVIGAKATNDVPLYEVNDIKSGTRLFCTEEELINYLLGTSFCTKQSCTR